MNLTKVDLTLARYWEWGHPNKSPESKNILKKGSKVKFLKWSRKLFLNLKRFIKKKRNYKRFEIDENKENFLLRWNGEFSENGRKLTEKPRKCKKIH